MGDLLLDTAIEAAKEAGQLIIDRSSSLQDAWLKGTRDVVTAADLAAEELILSMVRSRFPDHAVLSEEEGAIEKKSPYVWVVDPIDGTRNYSRRVPFYTVSIAILEDEQPIAGVVHDPERGHTFHAQKGGGALLNGDRVQVSSIENLEDSLLDLGWGRSDAERSATLQIVERLLPRCSSLRAMGSAALALAYVAAGWIDGYINLTVKPWDVAAGALIIEEAGGVYANARGESGQIMSNGCVASNGTIQGALFDLFAKQ